MRCYDRRVDIQDKVSNEGGLRAHFETCSPALLRLLTARMGNRSDAEDLLQELWIKLANADSGPISNPKAYLHRMALNLANDLVRERVRRRGREAAWTSVMVGDPDELAVDPNPTPERLVAGKMELERMRNAIAQLPGRAQEAFRLHRIEEMSHSQVAVAMGISRSAVEKHMATATKYLMRAMKNDDEG